MRNEMTQDWNELVWNRGGIIAFIEIAVAASLLSLIPLTLFVVALHTPYLPLVIGFCILISIYLLLFARIIPFRVGFSDSHVGFKSLIGGQGTIVHIADIIEVQYRVTQGGLKKPLKRRFYIVDMELEYHSRIRKICDGSITERLMKLLPYDKSKLIVTTLGGVSIEERAPTI